MYFTEHVPLAASPHPPAWQSASQLIVEVLQKSKAMNGLVGWLVGLLVGWLVGWFTGRGFLLLHIFLVPQVYTTEQWEILRKKPPNNKNLPHPPQKKAFSLVNKKT